MLENCHQNAEDTESDQMSPNSVHEDVSMKSLRDCIIYTEPLTPMLQEVLHDFDTDDDDDDEPKLQIVEDNALHKNGNGTRKSVSPDMRKSLSYYKQSPKKVVENVENQQVNGNAEVPKAPELSKIKSLKLKKTRKGIWENKDPGSINTSEAKDMDVETNNNISEENSGNVGVSKLNSESSEQTTQHSSTSTVDTQLPNNQEGLLYCEANDKRKSIKDIPKHEVGNNEHKKKSRKREHSQTNTEPKKKSKKNKNKEASALDLTNDTEGSSKRNSNEGQTNNENHETVLHESVQKSNENEQSNRKSGDVANDKENKNTTKPIGSPMREVSPSEINPCLKSVSLFAEQFCTSQFSDSDDGNNQSSVKEVPAIIHQGAEEHKTITNASNSEKNKPTLKEIITSKYSDVVVLHSNSESDSASFPACSKSSDSPTTLSSDKSRGQVLANLFGFSSGEFIVGHMYRGFIQIF